MAKLRDWLPEKSREETGIGEPKSVNLPEQSTDKIQNANYPV
jgi:hypothetical protein